MLNLSALTPYQPGMGASAISSPSGDLATRWLQPAHPRYEGTASGSSGSSNSSLPSVSPSIPNLRLGQGSVSPELGRSRPQGDSTSSGMGGSRSEWGLYYAC